MDDDIDIEEHDVLDNPRIKSMFPDLSRVKIEVPDDEGLEVQNSEETQEDYNVNPVLYQYEYNFVTEASNVASNISEYDNTENANENQLQYEMYDEENEAIPQYVNIDSGQPIADQDDMYADNDFSQLDSQSDYIPNKIILGSRPSHKVPCDYERLCEEALNSQAMVYLENWGQRLDNSPCYCKICKTLFPTINALDAHKMVSHSFLIAVNNNTARKSTGSAHVIPPKEGSKSSSDAGRLCNHCNNVFPNDTTLIKHLYELLPMSNFDAEKPNNVARSHFKIGSKIPTTESKVKTDSRSLITKIGVTNKNKSNVAIKRNNTECVAIAKSSVASSKIAVETAKKHGATDMRKPYYKCTLCQAILNSKYCAKRHRAVEHPSYSKIHIYIKFYKTDLKRRNPKQKGKIDRSFTPKSLLFKCGKCEIHFLSPYSALQHFIVCNEVYKSKNCTICRRNIILKDIESHYWQHDNGDVGLKVYTVTKTIYERVLCECPKCGVCFEELPFWAHIKLCNKVDFINCYICDKKIGKSRYRSHEIKHRIKNYTRKDFIVIKYFCHTTTEADNNIIQPIHNEIVNKDRAIAETTKKTIYFCPYCSCCQQRKTFRCHLDKMCKRWGKSHKQMCDKCGLMFSNKPYVVHRPLHDGNRFNLRDYNFVNIVTGCVIDPPLTPMYSCKLCHINFIRHTQVIHHACGEEKFDVCNICNKKFNPQAYLIHKQFHDYVEIMPELIMKYNSLSSTWNLRYMCVECDIVCVSYDTAVEHSQNHIVSHTDTSIYCKICNLTVHESYYKVHAELHETNSSLTVDSFKILKYDYKKLFDSDWMDFGDLSQQAIDVILSKSVYKNIRNVKMNVNGDSDAIKYICGNCKMSVDDVEIHLNATCKANDIYRCKYCKIKMDDLNDLVAHELRHENTRDQFKIVSFNDDEDRRFNAKLKKYSAKSKTLLTNHNTTVEKEKRFKAYCCRKCSVCVTLKQNTRAHRCLPANSEKYFCKRCDQYFTYKFRSNHQTAHKKFPNLSKKTLSIIYFNDSHTKAEKLAVEDPTPDIFKIVKLKGEKDTKLKLRLRKQTPKVEKRTENEKRYKVYRCKKCNVCVTMKQLMYVHRCTAKRYHCKHCNQHFSYKYKANHEKAHRIYPNLSNKILAVTYFGDDTVKIYKTDIPDNISVNTDDTYVLYKCECDVHFSSLKSIVKHTKTCNLTDTDNERCTECHLLFSRNDYPNHLRHHNKLFTIKTVIKSNWYQCSDCEILFLTENEVDQHYDSCDPKLGVKCDRCDFKYLRNCINSHRCCENETNLYIGTVTQIKQDLKEFTVYSCTKCDINYWSMLSYDKHARVNHVIRRKKVFCDICGLYFSKVSYLRHSDIHKHCKEYKIKAINPITKQHKVLKGKNNHDHEDNENTKDHNDINTRVAKDWHTMNDNERDNSPNVTRSRKRKIDSDHIMTTRNDVGKERTVENRALSPLDRAEECKGNIEFNTQEGDANSTLSETISDTVINRTDKSLYFRNNNTLYKCPECPLHYLHFESLKYHINRHSMKPAAHLECTKCHLYFTAITLRKHIYMQHEKDEFSLEDFDIRIVNFENGVYTGSRNESEYINENAIAGVFNDSNTEAEGSIDGESHDCIEGLSNDIADESTEASTIDSKDDTIAIDNSKKDVRLYKCANCNVCYIKQMECLQHVENHVTIDSKYYISCKICNFQFLISSLRLHMEVHHETEFRLEELMIEEYTVYGNDLDTKIDVYYALDRVQSRLISTTTDDGKDDI